MCAPEGVGRGEFAELVDVLAVGLLQPDGQGPAFAALERGADGGAAEAGLDVGIDLLDAQPVACEVGAADGDLEVGFALHTGRRDAGGALDARDDALDFEGLLLERVEVVAVDLHADLGADAGARHQDPVLDGLEEAGHVAGHVHELGGEVGDNGGLGRAGGPLTLGLQHDGGLDHLDRRRVGGGLGAAELAGDGGDGGVFAHDLVLPGHDALDLGERGGRQQDGHEKAASPPRGSA
jgi:hypothetical protein